jgi:hypothetical protein
MRLRRFPGRKIILGLSVCLFVFGVAIGILRHEIQSGLDRWCKTAQAAHPHPGDDVAAMLDYVQSDAHSLRERNYVVWALGQARDPRGVPVLERCLTGEPCNHAECLCQGELEKAIALCKSPTPNPLRIRVR